ncbi:MAG TPA: ferrous iron transport protein B [Opitutaceae bacterium]|nr:ferrous iron transport protein B [Opitutaceae bacterium]
MSSSSRAEPAPPPAAFPRPAGAGAPVYALVGNPNCGKSTLFNALTGLRQKVGNYAGVTVDKKVGTAYTRHGQAVTVIDLPGAFSLAARSPDEAVTRDVLLGRRSDTPQPDRILCVVDAANLERNLYLVHQVLDLGRPVLVVLNMMDLAAGHGIAIDADALGRELGVPVLPCEAVNGRGLPELKLALGRSEIPPARHAWEIPLPLAGAAAELQEALVRAGRGASLARAEALLLLAETSAPARPAPAVAEILERWRTRWRVQGVDGPVQLVQARYEAVAALAGRVVRIPNSPSITPSERIDAVAIHPVWGWLVFGAVMALLFLGIFTLAEIPMRWMGHAADAAGGWLRGHMAPGDLRDLLTDGVIAGVGSVAAFLPQILILFFFIGLLENTGYMARAAFIMDRLMSRVGLNGKSFIPLLSSYACAIPGIMAARTIEEPKDRLTTILVAPLMSCSARLPVYFLLIAALLPSDGGSLAAKAGLMLLMYLIGTGGAFGFAWLFKRTLLRGAVPPMVMELPPYRLPRLSDVARDMLTRAWMFLRQAGTVILAFSVVLWFLSAYPKLPAGAPPAEQVAASFAGRIGRMLEPAIRPLGFDWRIGIGLVSSMAAREVFVSSTAVVFRTGDPPGGDERALGPLRAALRRARWPDGRPLFTPLACLSLMLFYVFAMQCASTLAVVRRETGSWRWPALQLAYLTGTAWLVCFAVYQTGRALGF